MLPAQPTRLLRGFLSHPPGAVPTPQLHNPTPRAKRHLQLFCTRYHLILKHKYLAPTVYPRQNMALSSVKEKRQILADVQE